MVTDNSDKILFSYSVTEDLKMSGFIPPRTKICMQMKSLTAIWSTVEGLRYCLTNKREINLLYMISLLHTVTIIIMQPKQFKQNEQHTQVFLNEKLLVSLVFVALSTFLPDQGVKLSQSLHYSIAFVVYFCFSILFTVYFGI